MTLTIPLPIDEEQTLRRQAEAAGRGVEDYVADVLRRAMAHNNSTPSTESADRLELLREATRELLQRSQDLAPLLQGPTVDDPRRAWDEIMEQKARKQGLQL